MAATMCALFLSLPLVRHIKRCVPVTCLHFCFETDKTIEHVTEAHTANITKFENVAASDFEYFQLYRPKVVTFFVLT
jgi:arginyl-tRNA--protein-N-Asp/Glu arginylyltransferase